MPLEIAHETVPDYDALASFYDRHWIHDYNPWASRILERLLLAALLPGARVLDVCCGNGVMLAGLRALGYRCLGVDASPAMLAIAQCRVPDAELLVADVRAFSIAQPVDAALSTFDSLNYILSADDLVCVFRNVRACLIAGGRFVCDMTTEEAFTGAWSRSCAQIFDDDAFFVRGRYDAITQHGETLITLFQPEGTLWRRTDVRMVQRPWKPAEVMTLLREAGFAAVDAYEPSADPAAQSPMSLGRVFYIAVV